MNKHLLRAHCAMYSVKYMKEVCAGGNTIENNESEERL